MKDEEFLTSDDLDSLFYLAGQVSGFDALVGKKISKIHKKRLIQAGEQIMQIVEDYKHRFDYQPYLNKNQH